MRGKRRNDDSRTVCVTDCLHGPGGEEATHDGRAAYEVRRFRSRPTFPIRPIAMHSNHFLLGCLDVPDADETLFVDDDADDPPQRNVSVASFADLNTERVRSEVRLSVRVMAQPVVPNDDLAAKAETEARLSPEIGCLTPLSPDVRQFGAGLPR